MDISQLKRIPLFAEASDEELSPVLPFAESKEFPEGAVLMKEEGFSNDLFAIEEGEVEVTQGGKHVADLGRGEIFGEAGLLEDAKRNATVTAKSPVKVITLDIFDLKRLKRSAPGIYKRIEDLAVERGS